MWEDNFSQKLKIRAPTSHKVCSECTKHKYIIKKCICNRAAADAQSRMWSRHLQRQYNDRVYYWDLRAASRLGKNVSGQKTLTIIIDSMDRSKWALPRSEALMSKHLGTMHRPNLDVTAAICHGHLCAIYFAEPSIVKGSSWTCEVLCNLLHCLCMQGVDLRDYEVCLHGDNCSKEIKCNSIARLLSLLVSRRRVRRAQLQTLVSGHSHEDVDAFFALLGGYLQTQSELHNPEDFEDAVSRFLSNRSVRPNEPVCLVQRVSQVRDWSLRLKCLRVRPTMTKG